MRSIYVQLDTNYSINWQANRSYKDLVDGEMLTNYSKLNPLLLVNVRIGMESICVKELSIETRRLITLIESGLKWVRVAVQSGGLKWVRAAVQSGGLKWVRVAVQCKLIKYL